MRLDCAGTAGIIRCPWDNLVMRKTLLLLLGASLILLANLPVEAGWMTAARRDFYRSHYRSHCWPYPYNLMDQQSVRSPFQMMVANGWQMQNMIRSEHFESGSEKLNESGRRHVHWVLTRAPKTQRVLFVEPGESARQTARRLAAVEHRARLTENDETGVEVVLATVAPPAVTPLRATEVGSAPRTQPRRLRMPTTADQTEGTRTR